MISRHVDLIALGVLLLAIAAFSAARQAVVLTLNGPVRYIRLDNPRTRVIIPTMPETPPAPPVLQRD